MVPTSAIGGVNYATYSPEWYAAMDKQRIHDASITGQTEGTEAANASVSNWNGKYPGNQTPGPYDINPALLGLYGAAAGSTTPGYPGAAATAPTVAFGSGSAGSGAGVSAPTVSMDPLRPVNPIAPVAFTPPTEGQEGAARAATFARGRDTAAQTASASLTGLSDALSARGLTGGGYEAGQIGGTLGREANTIGEVSRQQSESELARAADVANRQYEGGIAQRGQDIGKAESDASRELAAASTGFQGKIAERGQDLNAGEAAASRNLDASKTAYGGAITQREQDLQARTSQAQYQISQAQLAAQQRSAALSGLTAALSTTRGVY